MVAVLDKTVREAASQLQVRCAPVYDKQPDTLVKTYNLRPITSWP